ncbi:hypothetical protein VQL36_05245 [Chengkuizengella sp. SCS-71B]|uniref:hypothetical protein n=1 Tax=Chengkuizengella sp. SCS-71B TaxID=3115290 RepID=UPI0032C2309C
MNFLKTKKNVILFLYFMFQIGVITLYTSSYSLISITEDIFIVTYLVFSFLVLFLLFINTMKPSQYFYLFILWLTFTYLTFYNLIFAIPMIGVIAIIIKKRVILTSLFPILISLIILYFNFVNHSMNNLDEFKPYIREIIPNGQKQIVITEYTKKDFFYGEQIVYVLEKEYLKMIKKRDILHTLSWRREEILEAKWINESEVKIGDMVYKIN